MHDCLSRCGDFTLEAPVGVIGDTHGLLRDEALSLMAGCGLILHLGDVGDETILVRLAALAPLVAVRGNIDREPWCAGLPERRDLIVNGWRLHLVHDRADIDPATPFDAVLFGHSHKPFCQWQTDARGRRLWFNPGSAGKRRFTLPITAARLLARPERLCCATVHLLHRGGTVDNAQ